MAERAHAKLSASGAHRWMACPASVGLEDGLPDTTSDYARYGTAAHDLAERCLNSDENADFYIGEPMDDDLLVDDDMAEAVQQYLDYVRAVPGWRFVEHRVDFSLWVPEGFGTADALVFDGSAVSVIDLKMGQGVRVEAQDNPQAMLYALGALNDFGFVFDAIDTFRLVIVQPRLDHISEHEISRDELLAFGEDAKARAAITLADEAEAVPGEKQCRFCKAKATCRALADHALTIALEGFDPVDAPRIGDPLALKNAPRLTPDELGSLIPQLDLLTHWAKAVEAHAVAELEHGRRVPGFKLVEGRSIRKWADEGEAETALRKRMKVAHLFTKKLITPAQAEKKLGKGDKTVATLTVKPPGKPTLAPASDKRPALEIDVTSGFDATGHAA